MRRFGGGVGGGGGGTYDKARRGDSPGKNPKGGSWYSSGIDPQSFCARRRSASNEFRSSRELMGLSTPLLVLLLTSLDGAALMSAGTAVSCVAGGPGVSVSLEGTGSAASVSVGESVYVDGGAIETSLSVGDCGSG